jgi:Ca2+-binding RTX toxin-like protein
MTAPSNPMLNHAPIDDRAHLALLGGVSTFDVITGTEDGDALVGTSGADSIDGLGGDDFLAGLGDNDTINGGSGDDLVRGGGGDDLLSGGDDNDYLRPGAGSDTLDGGAGIDRAGFFDSTVGVHVSLLLQGTMQDTGQGQVLLTNFEQLSGTRFDDLLIGDDNDNWLWGDVSSADPGTGGGDDTLIGNGGDDLLEVSTGNHKLNGGSGVDTVSAFGNATDTLGGVTVDLSLAGAQDTGQGDWLLKKVENLSGSIFGDELTGDGRANVLCGDAGDDTLSGGGRADALYGDGTMRVDAPAGTAGPVTLFANADDPSTGDPAAGHDLLDGGSGADTLLGGRAGDTLTGGGGADTFIYLSTEDSQAFDRDEITDLANQDVIDLSAIDADVTVEGDQAFTVVAAFTGRAGEALLSYNADLDVTALQLDTNGDHEADAEIVLDGKHNHFDNFVL